MLKMRGTNEDGTPWEMSIRCDMAMLDYILMDYWWKWDTWEYVY